METKLDKKRIKKLIDQYYKEIYGIEGNTKISVSEDYVGYGMGEKKDCVVEITYHSKINILEEETNIKIELTEEQLKSIISYFLQKDGYTLNSIYLDKGLEPKTEGYGYGEHTEYRPYFKGINIRINEKIKKIGEK